METWIAQGQRITVWHCLTLSLPILFCRLWHTTSQFPLFQFADNLHVLSNFLLLFDNLKVKICI